MLGPQKTYKSWFVGASNFTIICLITQPNFWDPQIGHKNKGVRDLVISHVITVFKTRFVRLENRLTEFVVLGNFTCGLLLKIHDLGIKHRFVDGYTQKWLFVRLH